MNTIPPFLEPQTTALLVIDLQERLLPAIDSADACVAAAVKTIQAAAVLGVATLATEQYPAGLGRTSPPVLAALGQTPVVEKMKFSACVDAVTAALAKLRPTAVIVVGIESHVCVQQSVLDLLRLNYVVYVCADAVSSRRPLDRQVALDRMRQAGAVITTTESVIFELTGEAGTERFKRILKIVR